MRLDFRGKTHVLTKKHPILRLVVSVKSAQGAKFNNNYAPCAVKLNATTSFTVFYCLRRTLCEVVKYLFEIFFGMNGGVVIERFFVVHALRREMIFDHTHRIESIRF